MTNQETSTNHNADTTPYIVCSGLFKIYKAAGLEVVALRGLELNVYPGEVSCQMNPTSCRR